MYTVYQLIKCFTNKFDVCIFHQPFCPILHKPYSACVKLFLPHKLPENEQASMPWYLKI